MTARDIQKLLIRERYRRNFVIPNYTPRGWFECDIFEITPAGFMREYEIKLSRSDFKADAAKSKTIWNWKEDEGRGESVKTKKYDQLATAHPAAPRQFWYVVPTDLIAVEEVPDWAGLIYVRLYEQRFCERQMKVAPMLHRQKSDPKVKQHAESICYWRFHNAFLDHKFEMDVTVNDQS